MSHSTQGGFNCPPTTWGKQSPATGVGHITRPTIVSKFGKRFSAQADCGVIVAAIAEHERGVGQRIGCVKSLGERPPERIAIAFVLLASGVGNNPDAVASVRGANGGSWYAMPLSIIPERGQGSENLCKPSTKQSCDVLQDNEAWSQFANQAGDLKEKTGARTIKAGSPSCVADVLAREPAADDVNGNSIGSKPLCGEGSDVIVTGDLGPMLRQHTAGEGFDFAEGDRLESARPLKAEGEAANTAEKVEDAEHLRHRPQDHSPERQRDEGCCQEVWAGVGHLGRHLRSGRLGNGFTDATERADARLHTFQPPAEPS